MSEPAVPLRRRPTSPEEPGRLGFPAPPPPPANTVAEPSAVGGVTYQPLRDPRPSDGSAPVLGRRESSEGGKHTVPDELVRAATYRLPPDRVFRAKVPNSTPLPEQTTYVSLPKPRGHSDENVVPPS